MNLVAAALTNRWRDVPWTTVAPPDTSDPREAWAALAPVRGDADWHPLFHVRRRGHRGLWRRMRGEALRLRVNPSAHIPPAYYAAFPPTVDDAVRFSVHASRARRAESLARDAAARLDVLGTPIHRTGRRAPVPRRNVWTMRTGVRHCERTVLLLTKLLLAHLDDDAIAARVRHAHWHGEAPVCTIALGALAWRALCERHATVPPTSDACGAKLYVHAVGVPFSELGSPYDPLIELLDLGVGLVGIGDEAIATEILAGA